MDQETDSELYRQDETKRLFSIIHAGESASVIGVSGIGKSNLFNQLQDPKIQNLFIGDDYQNFYIIRVDCHYLPNFSDRSIYSLVLEQLENLNIADTDDLVGDSMITAITKCHEGLLDSPNDALRVQRFFKLAIRSILRTKEKHLILLLDQFDEVFRSAETTVFTNFRGLREAYKYRVSFITFTRDMLPWLSDLDIGREEFYELLESNIVLLKPYKCEDAFKLIERVSARNNLNISNSIKSMLVELSGGHAGFLRESLIAIARANLSKRADKEDVFKILISSHSIYIECKKIWNSLCVEEKQFLISLTQGRPTKIPNNIPGLLEEKGIITYDENEWSVFSQLLKEFIKQQEPLWENRIFFDEARQKIWVLGHPAPLLTAQELRLFKLLYTRSGEVVSKDELIESGWPNSRGGVSDEALMVAMSRLRRKLEPDPENPQFIDNIREQGYRLNIDR